MPFPSTLSTFARPNSTDRLNNPSHSALHNTVSSALGQVEAVIGVSGISSVVGTMMYDLRSPASSGGGHIQTANKGGTGQTSFNKGDILVAQSSSVLTKLAVGTNSYLLVADSSQNTGVKWTTSSSVLSANIPQPTINTYYASSVAGWSKPSLLSYIVVEVVGGGGGGGGCTTNGAGNGGGAGGYARKRILALSLGASENITIGAGGASNSNAAGDAGGTTLFSASSLVSATGGSGGSTGGAGGSNNGTAGGSGVSGDVITMGGMGDTGIIAANVSKGGMGGATYFGGGAAGAYAANGGANTGAVASVVGSGGAGGASGGAGGATAGSSGKSGVVIVTEYYI